MKVILDPEVHSDILGIMEYYDGVAGSDIAADFYRELRRYIDQISERPRSFPIFQNSYRRVNLRRFPHHIIYRVVDENYVRILVVRHDSRDPSFGLDR